MKSVAQKVTINIAKHWTKYIFLASGFYISLALLTPVLIIGNMHQIARALYKIYSLFCHQNAYKSWVFLGSQSPLRIRLSPSFDSHNLSFYSLLDPEKFIGTVDLGWKTALCHRCTAIYLGVFTASLLYHAFKLQRLHVPVVHPATYIIVGLLPILLHTIFLPATENILLGIITTKPHIMSTITGGLFGIMSAWFSFPEIDNYSQTFISHYSDHDHLSSQQIS